MAPGPGNWILRRDVENLTKFSFSAEFRTIDLTARAVKLRVVQDVVPDVTELFQSLQEMQSSHFRRPHQQWHYNSFVQVLHNNTQQMRNIGVTIAAITSKHQSTDMPLVSFQKCARSLICEKQQFNLEARVRHKLSRWPVTDPPAHVTRRAIFNFSLLAQHCRPAVCAAYLRAIFNGWPTTSRMRSMHESNAHGKCVFGCLFGDDRLEHYAVCKVVWQFFAACRPMGLGLPSTMRTLQDFLLLSKVSDTTIKIRFAVGIYAVAKTVHCLQKQIPNAATEHNKLLRMFALAATERTRANKIWTP